MDESGKIEPQRRSEFSENQKTRLFPQDDEISTQDPTVVESVSTEWTDEKHRMYLKSMEATFVDQLYDSLDYFGRCSSQKKSSNTTLIKQVNPTSSGQFKVLRSGSWQKINFGRPDSQLKKTSNPSDILENPWIQHFKSPCKAQTQTVASSSPPCEPELKSRAINSSGKKALSCESTVSTENFATRHSQSCNYDLVGNNTEVSDQNFSDEETKGERMSKFCFAKKMKTRMGDASSHDQVVPHGKPPQTENAMEECDFPTR